MYTTPKSRWLRKPSTIYTRDHEQILHSLVTTRATIRKIKFTHDGLMLSNGINEQIMYLKLF